LPVPGVFATNSTITVAVTPIRPVTAAGILKFTFWGYKALGGNNPYPNPGKYQNGGYANMGSTL
jgi:hypothetical protein